MNFLGPEAQLNVMYSSSELFYGDLLSHAPTDIS